jgi:uncharacterized protein (TIGR02246 family)
MRAVIFRRLPRLALALLACSLVTTDVRSATSPPEEHPARQAIEGAMQHYTELLRTGPPEALAATFTAEGELLEPGMAAVHGRDAIRSFLAPLFSAVTVESASTESETVEVFGTAAYQWGTYRQRVAEHGKPAADYHGRYVAAWRREADGHWRLARMLVQPFPPGAP